MLSRGENMEKTIKIGGKDVKLSNNVAWTMEYRDQFGHDVVQDHIPVLASITEALASIIADTGKTDNITLGDLLEAVEGRTMDIMMPLFQTEFMSIIINATWAMAKAADETTDEPKRWVRQFDTFELDIIAPTVYDMAFRGFVSSKNLEWLTSLKKQIKISQPLPSTQSSSQEQSED